MRKGVLAIAPGFVVAAAPAAAERLSAVIRPRAVAGWQAIGRVWQGDSARPHQAGAVQTCWQGYVNDRPVDLAYPDVRHGECGENGALQLGLTATGVPRLLAPTRIAR